MADPQAVEIEFNAAREDLRRITSAPRSGEFERPFQLLRDGLSYELGVLVPPIRWRPREDLLPGHFAFRIAGEATASHALLGPDELVVDAPAAALPLAVVREERDPNRGTPWAVIDVAARARLPAERRSWDALEYAALVLAAEIRGRAATLVTQEFVERELRRVAMSFPVLVELCTARFGVAQIHATLAGLVDERVCIRDLATVLERLLDFDRVVVDDLQNIFFDPRLPVRDEDLDHAPSVREFVDHVRAGLARALTFELSRGSNTIDAYLLERDIEVHLEQQRRRRTPPDPEIVRGIVDAFARELGDAGARTVVLTSSYVRHGVRSIIADAFPWLPVLAYTELDPSCNIRPLARISLG